MGGAPHRVPGDETALRGDAVDSVKSGTWGSGGFENSANMGASANNQQAGRRQSQGWGPGGGAGLQTGCPRRRMARGSVTRLVPECSVPLLGRDLLSKLGAQVTFPPTKDPLLEWAQPPIYFLSVTPQDEGRLHDLPEGKPDGLNSQERELTQKFPEES